jgi:hypothetical protein
MYSATLLSPHSSQQSQTSVLRGRWPPDYSRQAPNYSRQAPTSHVPSSRHSVAEQDIQNGGDNLINPPPQKRRAVLGENLLEHENQIHQRLARRKLRRNQRPQHRRRRRPLPPDDHRSGDPRRDRGKPWKREWLPGMLSLDSDDDSWAGIDVDWKLASQDEDDRNYDG